MELAKSYSEAQINRLQAVETKSGTLAVFAAVVTGLLIGQDAAGTGPLAWAAVGLVGAAVLVAAVVAGCASWGFRWPDPKSTGFSLEEHPSTRRHDRLLEEHVRRGAANRRRLSVWEQRAGASARAVHGVAATTVMAPAARG